jgi:hypothetical protein
MLRRRKRLQMTNILLQVEPSSVPKEVSRYLEFVDNLVFELEA